MPTAKEVLDAFAKNKMLETGLTLAQESDLANAMRYEHVRPTLTRTMLMWKRLMTVYHHPEFERDLKPKEVKAIQALHEKLSAAGQNPLVVLSLVVIHWDNFTNTVLSTKKEPFPVPKQPYLEYVLDWVHILIEFPITDQDAE